jgi:hypothetical protein
MPLLSAAFLSALAKPLAELFKRHLMLLCLILGQIVRCVIHLEISIIMDAG